jgi:hypothetical protein
VSDPSWRRTTSAFALVAVLVAGCSTTPSARVANLDGGLPNPSPAFMKKVDKDPFPDAPAAGSRKK